MLAKIRSRVSTYALNPNTGIAQPIIVKSVTRRWLIRYADEELIKYGWDEDVWFHADNLSSAHIYVRLPEGEDWEKMSPGLLTDCAQLTKANSIEGNKKDNVTIVYTPWSNLKKDGSMAVGQVGFKDQRKVSIV